MPRIRVSIEQLMQEIIVMPEDNEDFVKAWSHIYENGFIFNEFTLIAEGNYINPEINALVNKMYELKGEKRTWKVKVIGVNENQKIEIKSIWWDKQGIAHNNKSVIKIDDWMERITKDVIQYTKQGIKEYQNWNVNKEEVEILPAMMFMQYAVIKAMNREIIEMPTTNRRYKPIKERSKSKPKEEYKLFDVIRKYSQHINHNKHFIICEKWDVKGHFRHYKNGKVVYVKPYEKGKGRKKEREYKL